MPRRYFNDHDFKIISEALDIAEDATGDYYRFSLEQWKRHRYDIKTLWSLDNNEVSQHAFAVLNWGSMVTVDHVLNSSVRDFFFICLQDHIILNAVARDSNIALLPILVYVFTHELVHIVRFSNFVQRVDVPANKREKEERIVHELTFNILKNLPVPKLYYVLDRYQGHRICDFG
ncbi:MAG: hypothetical protein J7J52_05585 [Deltaproteobacteria bacterium]|nr:hypothetical protein [Deltaproteobacteria bacterium]